MRHKTKLYALGGLAAGALAIAGVASAHHAFSAEFDADAPVLLRGEVTKVEWVNPHTWIHLAAEEEGSDETTAWMVEGGTPNTLLRNGLNKNSLKPGTPIIVRGYQSKDRLCAPACKANGRDITLSNGEKVFMGSSGTGAPRDGTDPRERGPVTTELPDADM